MPFRDDRCRLGDRDIEQLIIIKCILNFTSSIFNFFYHSTRTKILAKPFLVSEIIDIKFKDVY